MTRSNRSLTQFAVDQLKDALNSPFPLRSLSQAGNTRVELGANDTDAICGHTLASRCFLAVSLHGKEIVKIWFSAGYLSVESIFLYAGDFYDSKGRPSRTTRERLNGILDALGEAEVIPKGVRAFIDSETGQSRIGKGSKYRAFDATHERVGLFPDKNRLEISQ